MNHASVYFFMLKKAGLQILFSSVTKLLKETRCQSTAKTRRSSLTKCKYKRLFLGALANYRSSISNYALNGRGKTERHWGHIFGSYFRAYVFPISFSKIAEACCRQQTSSLNAHGIRQRNASRGIRYQSLIMLLSLLL